MNKCFSFTPPSIKMRKCMHQKDILYITYIKKHKVSILTSKCRKFSLLYKSLNSYLIKNSENSNTVETDFVKLVL